MISVGFARVSKKRPYRICGKISFYDPRNSHFMTDEFHFMTEPTIVEEGFDLNDNAC